LLELFEIGNAIDFDKNTTALALMATASFCSGVQNKRYSEQQDKAPDSSTSHNRTCKENFEYL
jgi:hypothetical protein